jgi:hypothetical protein
MSTSSLSSIKKNFGISDDLPIEYEKKGDELILHIPLRLTYRKNKEIINQARKLVHQREKSDWSRNDFFDDFMKVRNRVLKEVRAHYGKN